MAKCCITYKGAKWVIGICSIILVICLAVLFIFPNIYQAILKKRITLTEGSLVTTKVWEDIPLPLYEKIYFFNITNADEFLDNKEPLNVTEIGPYVYKGRWVKDNPTWNSNGTVSYREIRTYQFVREMSVGSQDDIINTLNGPMIIAASILKNYNIIFRAFLAFAMKLEDENVVTQKTVKQLVYDGYYDPIINYAPILKPNIPYKNGIFSWLYGKNATDDGLFTVFTGENNASLTDIINNWNGNETLSFWKNDSCNALRGTSIETGPPLNDVPDVYTFFQSIFCRSIDFNFTGDQTHYGVLTKRFKPTSMVFANSTENPDNKCYEVEEEHPSGVLDISPCQFGAPVFISFPHFFLGDPAYLQNISGLSPNEDDHGSHLDIEPITGVTVHAGIKFQINVKMQRVRGVFQLDNTPEGIYPIFWVKLQIELTESWANFLKGQLNNPKIITYSVLSIVALGSLILLISGAIVLHRENKSPEDDPLIGTEEYERKLRKQSSVTQNSKKHIQNFENSTDNKINDTIEEQYFDSDTKLQATSHVQEHPTSSKD